MFIKLKGTVQKDIHPDEECQQDQKGTYVRRALDSQPQMITTPFCALWLPLTPVYNSGSGQIRTTGVYCESTVYKVYENSVMAIKKKHHVLQHPLNLTNDLKSFQIISCCIIGDFLI